MSVALLAVLTGATAVVLGFVARGIWQVEETALTARCQAAAAQAEQQLRTDAEQAGLIPPTGDPTQ